MNEKMKRFRRLVLGSTVATYLLIFIGGLVRVSGAGLGCPDWPKCFGRWFPPLSIDQIPPDFNAAGFNITLAWIEYINRLAGMLTGILIAVTAFLALKNFRDKKNILIPAVLAALFVAFQGWYGSIVVKSQLMPLTISVHLLIALIIVSLLLYTLINVYFSDKPLAGDDVKPLRNLMRILWLAAMIQIAIGTEIRSAIESIWQEFPLLSGAEVLLQTGSIILDSCLPGYPAQHRRCADKYQTGQNTARDRNNKTNDLAA